MQVLCLAGGLERFSLPVLSSVAAITVGTGLTAFLEMRTASFDLVGECPGAIVCQVIRVARHHF